MFNWRKKNKQTKEGVENETEKSKTVNAKEESVLENETKESERENGKEESKKENGKEESKKENGKEESKKENGKEESKSQNANNGSDTRKDKKQVTFSENIACYDEPSSSKGPVSKEESKEVTSDLIKKTAVAKAKRLLAEVQQCNLPESMSQNALNLSVRPSESVREIPKVVFSSERFPDEKPKMSEKIVLEYQAEQMVSELWKASAEKDKSETEKDRRGVISYFKKILPPKTEVPKTADVGVQSDDLKPKASVREVPKLEPVVFSAKPRLEEGVVAEKKAQELLSQVGVERMRDIIRERQVLPDLKRTQIAIDKAKRLISAVSEESSDEEKKLRTEFCEDGEEKAKMFDDAVYKTKLLLSALAQKEVTGSQTPLITETTTKQAIELIDSDIPIETIESLKIDVGQGIEQEIEDIVNQAGYGKFQNILFMLCGITWMITNFELMHIFMFGELIACEWTIYTWQNSFLISIAFAGSFTGALFFGILSDVFGRKRAIGMSTLLLFLIVLTTTLSTNLSTMLVFRLLFGFAIGGLMQVFLLFMEYCPTTHRGTGSIYLTFYWSAGALLSIITTNFITQTVTSWKWLQVVSSIPLLCLFFALKWFPESARVLHVNHQYNQAVKLLEQMLTMNKERIDESRLKRLKRVEERGNLVSLLRKKNRAETLMLWYISFAACFGYYWIVMITPFVLKSGGLRVFAETFRYSTDFFRKQLYCQKYTFINSVHLFWTTASEIPALFIFLILIERVQRKTLLCFSFFVTGTLSLMLLIDTSYVVLLFSILFLIRAPSQVSTMLPFLIISEVYPTTTRGISYGSAVGFGALGAAMVPYVTLNLVVQHPIMTTCASAAIVLMAGIMAACLPIDTKDVPLKDVPCNSSAESRIPRYS